MYGVYRDYGTLHYVQGVHKEIGKGGMRRAILFLNGNLSNVQRVREVIRPDDVLICADGGVANLVTLNLVPHVMIGDFDSISVELEKKLREFPIEWISFPKEKEFTDSELVLEYVVEQRFQKVVMCGVLGDRLDHVLVNVTLFEKYASHFLEFQVIEGDQDIYIVRDFKEVVGQKGDLLSLIPLRGDCFGVKTMGLQYPLNEETLFAGSSRGVSNVFTLNKVTVQLSKGVLMVVHTRV